MKADFRSRCDWQEAWLDKNSRSLSRHIIKISKPKQSREIDLVSRLYGYYETARESGIYELETFCAIECKASPKPWVVFKEVAQSQWGIERAITNDLGRRLLNVAEEHVKETALDNAASQRVTTSNRRIAKTTALSKP